MQLTNKISATLLVSLVAVSVFALSGCRSGGFTKPDLSHLAFWKKDGDALASKTVPPPPARHFDPAPIKKEMDKHSEIVNLDGGNLERRFDNNIDEALKEIKSAANGPIRKPYSTGTESTGNKSTGNDFSPAGIAASSGKIKSKQFSFDNGRTKSTDNGMSLAQKEFQAAMNSAKQSTSNAFAGRKNAPNEFSQGWKDDIKLPTGLSQSANNSVDQSLASVNQSLNKANNRMAEVGANAAGAFQAKTNNFANNAQSKIDSASKTANDFVADTRGNLSSATKPISDFASNNNFAPQGVATPSASSGIGKIESAQVAEAKQQIASLKMQIENANRNVASSLPNPASMKHQPLAPAPGRVAKLEVPGFKSAYTNPGSINGAPANGLRPNNQPLLPNAQQPLAPQTPPNNFSPSYPSTPHGGFVPKSNPNIGSTSANTIAMPPMKPASHAGFNNNTNKSNVVTAGSQVPATGSASRIQNHVSEVDIPDSILKGQGSYSPGSVNALKK